MKIKINNILLFVSTSVLSLYFIYSALNGQYGLFNKFKYQSQELVLLNKLEEIKIQTSTLENKVQRLSDNYLDLDLLDQQARKILGVAKSNEIIIQFN
jgi:cell division protein FtsB